MEQKQPTRVGRRLAAIVAADVAGYSRLMGLDEVGTARTLREHRKVTDALVEKHGGRLVKSTGDGMLLEFPSVVDAVECTVAVQTMMAQRSVNLPLRIVRLLGGEQNPNSKPRAFLGSRSASLIRHKKSPGRSGAF
jgi:class 3 adenylate cyclase